MMFLTISKLIKWICSRPKEQTLISRYDIINILGLIVEKLVAVNFKLLLKATLRN